MKLLGLQLVLFSTLSVVYSSNDPVGHLQPLGFQRPPSVDIDEFTVDNAPTPEEFYQKYVRISKAAVFRNAVTKAEAFTGWSEEEIAERFGDLEVRLEGKKEKGKHHPYGGKYLGRDTLGHFVATGRNLTSKTYVVSELPEAMYSDVAVMPSVGACGEMAKRFVEIDLWWSSGGSKSVIHKDAYNQINCLYKGVKYWKLFEHKYEKWIHKHWEPENEIGGFSDINVERVDMHKHPNIAKVPWSNITINAGDCLFLPKSYYHQVDSSPTNNLAVSFLFSRFDGREKLDMSDCTKETDYQKVKRLSDLEVMWKWSGKGMMSMGNGDFEENYRNELKEAVADLETVGKGITEEYLMEAYGGARGQNRYNRGSIKTALNAIDANGDGEITMDEVENANWDQLRIFGVEVEYFEPSNSLDYEYNMVNYPQVLDLLQRLLKRKEKITRDQWVRIYTKFTIGTPYRANDIFTSLSGSNETNVIQSKDITPEMLEKALEKWKEYFSEPSEEDMEEEEEEEEVTEEEDGILSQRKQEL